MEIIKDLFRFLMFLVSFGGTERLKDAKDEYQIVFQEYTTVREELSKIQYRINHAANEIGNNIKNVMLSLKKAKHLLLNYSEFNVNEEGCQSKVNERIVKLNTINSNYTSLLLAGTGALGGGTVAIGAWAIVSAIGTASTGTVIGTLSGAAATNATLAWFGGGALASGGAGMLGGMSVLGGIVAAPMIILTSFMTHKKARKFEEDKVNINIQTDEIKVKTKELKGIAKDVEDNKVVIISACKRLDEIIYKSLKIIYPYGVLSKLMFVFYKSKFSEEQKNTLDLLGDEIDKFYELIGGGKSF